MKSINILIIIILATFQIKAQTNQAEIDKLAKLYKDSSDVVIYTTYGELKGHATIEKNNDSLPQAVLIHFEGVNIDAASEFLSNLIKKKISQGYQSGEGHGMLPDDFDIENRLKNTFSYSTFIWTYKKGNMYFIARGGNEEEVTLKNLKGETETVPYYITWFSIETGDNSRKGGKQAKEFKF